jgi:hypothetical protein
MSIMANVNINKTLIEDAEQFPNSLGRQNNIVRKSIQNPAIELALGAPPAVFTAFADTASTYQ